MSGTVRYMILKEYFSKRVMNGWMEFKSAAETQAKKDQEGKVYKGMESI